VGTVRFQHQTESGDPLPSVRPKDLGDLRSPV
jgi:hypothetical protein